MNTLVLAMLNVKRVQGKGDKIYDLTLLKLLFKPSLIFPCNCILQQNPSLPDHMPGIIESVVMGCIDSVNYSVKFDNQVYTPKTINGVISKSDVKFYTSEGGDFIFYDSAYNSWRIGGGAAETIQADCSSLGIC